MMVYSLAPTRRLLPNRIRPREKQLMATGARLAARYPIVPPQARHTTKEMDTFDLLLRLGLSFSIAEFRLGQTRQ